MYNITKLCRCRNILTSSTVALLLLPRAEASPPSTISLSPLGTYQAGSFLTSAAEIAAHDPITQRLYVVNAQAARIDVLSIIDPLNPVSVGTIAVAGYGAVANSVSVHSGIIAVAVEANPKTDPGKVVFFNSGLQPLSAVTVGAQPDMLVFAPDGRTLLVANEGEPAEDYSIDPEGSVSVIRLPHGPAGAGAVVQSDVIDAGFSAYNGFSPQTLFYGNGTPGTAKPAIRVFGPETINVVSQNLEPEYITISQDSKTAWVTLQEANSLAILDIPSGSIRKLVGLGTKNHNVPGNGLDASDADGTVNIRPWPVEGLYLPDAIASFRRGPDTFLVLANEGDSRDWDGYGEEERIRDLALDPIAFPDAASLKGNAQMGKLRVTSAQGDPDGDGVYSELYSFGSRSVSIRDAAGNLVWDSGDQIEQITSTINGVLFNSNHETNSFDNRSDDKGPEPEAITTGQVGGRIYAFLGLERVGGIMVFDVTEPTAPFYVDYVNRRNFTFATTLPAAGDLGPEGVLFIKGESSPTGKPLLVVANEVSGTTTLFAINLIHPSRGKNGK